MKPLLPKVGAIGLDIEIAGRDIPQGARPGYALGRIRVNRPGLASLLHELAHQPAGLIPARLRGRFSCNVIFLLEKLKGRAAPRFLPNRWYLRRPMALQGFPMAAVVL